MSPQDWFSFFFVPAVALTVLFMASVSAHFARKNRAPRYGRGTHTIKPKVVLGDGRAIIAAAYAKDFNKNGTSYTPR